MLSLLIAVAASAVGLAAVGLADVGSRPNSLVRLGVSGVVAGLGIAAMRYTGMAAMLAGSPIGYDTTLAATSIAIAVVAAIAAL